MTFGNYIQIGTDNPEKWDQALDGINHAFAHTWEYSSNLEKSTGSGIYLFVAKNNYSKLIVPFSIREKEPSFRDIFSPYGYGGIIYQGPESELLELKKIWIEFAQNHDIIAAYIMQNPLFLLPKSWNKDIYEHQAFYIIDLSKSIEQLWQQMHSTHRYEIRKSNENKEIKIIVEKEKLKNELPKLYYQTLERVSASQVYYFSESFLSKLVESENVFSIGIEVKGTMEAISVFTSSNYAADYFINSSLPNGKQHSRRLIWTAIEQLKQNGVKYLNLGGGVQNSDHLEQFKRRFGGTMLHNQVIKQIFQNEKYMYLIEKYCKENKMAKNYFPAYW
jgi:hypothetical protein